jgi:hypothetical protein
MAPRQLSLDATDIPIDLILPLFLLTLIFSISAFPHTIPTPMAKMAPPNYLTANRTYSVYLGTPTLFLPKKRAFRQTQRLIALYSHRSNGNATPTQIRVTQKVEGETFSSAAQCYETIV